eukprot:scaffold3987_cov118-Isochrysis_galbana.AAC.6
MAALRAELAALRADTRRGNNQYLSLDLVPRPRATIVAELTVHRKSTQEQASKDLPSNFGDDVKKRICDSAVERYRSNYARGENRGCDRLTLLGVGLQARVLGVERIGHVQRVASLGPLAHPGRDLGIVQARSIKLSPVGHQLIPAHKPVLELHAHVHQAHRVLWVEPPDRCGPLLSVCPLCGGQRITGVVLLRARARPILRKPVHALLCGPMRGTHVGVPSQDGPQQMLLAGLMLDRGPGC